MAHAPKGRREDVRLLKGQGAYASDWNLPRQAYGMFMRSDRAHADIVKLDVTEAASMKGVLLVVTGADLARENFDTPEVLAFFKGKNGCSVKIPHRPMLAHERVRYVGEAIAFVVAESEAIAQAAIESIMIEMRDQPVTVSARAALSAGQPQIHADAPGNLAFEFEYGDEKAVKDAFARAAHVVEVALDAQRIAGNPMEPKSCLASFDARANVFDLYSPSQGMAGLQNGMAHIMRMQPSQFRIHAKDVGGAFGVRNEVYPEYVVVAHAARALKRPVKWTGTRAETLSGDHHGRAAELTGTLALDDKGNFLAMKIGWLVNMGAYCSEAGALINTVAGPTATAVNIYKTPLVYGLHRLAFTNTTPTTAYRGAGRPNVAYLAERLVDEAARVSGIDKITLRRRNLLRKTDYPYRSPTGSVYDSGDPAALLDLALQEADWKGFATRRKEARKRGMLRGIGCATFVEPAGMPGHEEIALKFAPDGKLQMFTLSGPSGQGHETTYPEIVASILGLPSDQIVLHYSDPDGPKLIGTGTFGSRSTSSHGAALAEGASEVVRKAREIAAGQLEVAADDLDFKNGRFSVTGTDLSISLTDIVEKFSGRGTHPLDTQWKIETAGTFPSGAHIAEVEIDPETGTLDIIKYVAVDDCGNVLNHQLVEGQVVGGIIQGLGQVVGEQCVYDEDSGQFLTGTFMDYFMPRADALADIVVRDIPSPTPNNSLGVKGAGEAGTTGAVPTIANAVMDALAPLGIHHIEMPYTPYKLWQAIDAATKGTKAA